MKRLLALCTVLMLLFSFAAAEDEIIEDVMLDDEPASDDSSDAGDGNADDSVVFTPSYGSPYPVQAGSHSYWDLPMNITDEAAVWDMLMKPITVVDVGKKSSERVQAYLYEEPDEHSKRIGVVTCESQGVRVLEDAGNGWTKVECYSSSFHDTKVKAWNLLVNGYIKTAYLKEVTPNPDFGIVIDKLNQRLYIFQDGKLLTTLLCSTGITQWNGKKYQPYNETRSGEFLLMSKVGVLKSDRLLCDMAIRYNSGDMIHEVPHVLNGDGSKNYKNTEPKLGTKCSHGCIRVQRYKTPEGVNMGWIYNRVKSKSKIKIVIWEDWQGRRLPVPSGDTTLYYNANGKGQYYHRTAQCNSAPSVTFSPFRYDQLGEEPFSKLKACPWCVPEMRPEDIEEINDTYAPGKDHDELLTRLRGDYYEYLEKD